MNAVTRTAVINALAASTTPVPLADLKCKPTEVGELVAEGLVAVTCPPPAMVPVVSLTRAGHRSIPPGKSTTTAQHAVLDAISEATSGQLPTTTLYDLEGMRVTPAVLLDMVARGWCKCEWTEADDDTPAVISVTLTKDGNKALAFPVRAGATGGGSGGPRTARGEVVHAPIPDKFTRKYHDVEYHINHTDGKFTVDELDGEFTSLTAVAKAIKTVHGASGEVNGWEFFGLNK